MFWKTFNIMGWEAAILEALSKWHSSLGRMWVVEMLCWREWWSQVPPGMTMPLPGSSWARDCAWFWRAQRSPARWTWVCFSSCCCFCCWENSNHLAFPHSEALTWTVALGPKTALLTSVWTIPSAHRWTKCIWPLLGELPRTEEWAAALGVPSVSGDWKKMKSEVLEEGPCYHMLPLQMFGKIFATGWEWGADFKNVGREKLLVFPEQSVF